MTKRSWKGWFWLGVRIVLGAALLVLAFRQVDWSQIVPAVADVHLFWLVLGLFSVLLGLGLRIWRWQILLRNYQIEARIMDVAGAYLVGQAANIVMPVRSGEIFRFGWLRARCAQGSVAMLASIAIEKYLDLWLLLLFFVGVIPYLPVEVIEDNLTILLAGSILLTVFLIVAVVSAPRLAIWLSANVTTRFRWASAGLQSVAGWLGDSTWMQSPRRFLPAVALTVASWCVMALTNLLVLLAVDLPLDMRAAVLVLVLVYVGSAPALVPGNIGPFHFFAMLALSLAGLGGIKSVVFALFLHALVTLPPLLLSAGFLLANEHSQKSARTSSDAARIDA